MRSLSYSLIVLLTLSLVGCDGGGLQDLDVENETNPNRERVLAEPADIQSIANGTFESFFRGTEGYNNVGGIDSWSPSNSASVMADVHTASWGNFAMQDSGREPRIPWNNSPAYNYAHINEQPYFQDYTTISNTVDVLAAVESVGRGRIDDNLSPGAAARMEAFALFNMGLSYLHLGARFDKGALIDETDEFQGEEFVPYPEVVSFGLDKMAKAIQVANNNQFNIPASPNWFFNLEMSSSEFAGLANSIRAKYATLAARTPSERQNLPWVDGGWSTVLSWVNNGMRSTSGGFASGVFGPRSYPGSPAGFFPVGSEGIPRHFDTQLLYGTNVAQFDTWARADYKAIGPANTATYSDGTNKYDRWKQSLHSSPGDLRDDIYLTESPDRRIVGGTDPTCGTYVSQGRVGFGEGACSGMSGQELDHAGDGLYTGFRGTVTVQGGELAAIPFVDGPFPPGRGRWHYSDRAHDRYVAWQLGAGAGPLLGPIPHTLEAEMDLLKAEALLHTGGDPATVVALINDTRVNQGQLPPATTGDPTGSMTDQPSNPLKARGATIWSMLKHERLIETWNSSSGVTYMVKRGWGDLRKGALLHYPIPGAELETLGEDLYTFGAGESCFAQGPGNSPNTSGCTPSFGGGGGGSIVVDSDSHWSTFPVSPGSKAGGGLTLQPR